MRVLLWAVYVLGFILTTGILGAMIGWNEPTPMFAGLLWPVVLPIMIVHHYAKRYITARREREKLLREIESEL